MISMLRPRGRRTDARRRCRMPAERTRRSGRRSSPVGAPRTSMGARQLKQALAAGLLPPQLPKVTLDPFLLLLGQHLVVQPVDQGIGASINRFSVSAGSDESEVF